MADYSKQTWVDDDGTDTVGTVFTKARMDHIEDGILAAGKRASLVPGAQADTSQIEWRRAADGALVAYDWTSESISGSDVSETRETKTVGVNRGKAQHTIVADASDLNGRTAKVVLLADPTSGVAAGSKAKISILVFANPGSILSRTILDDTGASDFAHEYGAWTALPFATNWGNYGAGEQPGQYRTTLDGKSVQVRGLVKVSAAVTLGGTNSIIATLPAGSRPPSTGSFYYRVYVSAGGTTGTMVTMGIAPNGVMTLFTELTGRSLTYSSGTYVGLDGIEFSTVA